MIIILLYNKTVFSSPSEHVFLPLNWRSSRVCLLGTHLSSHSLLVYCDFLQIEFIVFSQMLNNIFCVDCSMKILMRFYSLSRQKLMSKSCSSHLTCSHDVLSVDCSNESLTSVLQKLISFEKHFCLMDGRMNGKLAKVIANQQSSSQE